MVPEMSSSCREVRASGNVPFEPEFYLIAFSSASHCIETEKKAKEQFQVHIIPTPREITASCGMALRFQSTDKKETMEFFRSLDVPTQLYAMGQRGQDGKRPAKQLAERR